MIPKGVFSDIVTSYLPHWDDTRAWIIARPLSGFAETFSQYVMEVAPGGGSDRPEPDAAAEGVLFVTEGELALTLAGKSHTPDPGRLRLHPARLRAGACETRPKPRRASTGSARPTSPSTACPRPTR